MACFHLCDDMPAHVLAVALCLSVTSQCSIKTDGRVDLVFGTDASFNQSCSVIRMQVSTKITVLLSIFPTLRT